MRFQHVDPKVWFWSSQTDKSKSYWNFSDLNIAIDHIITTSPVCFLHKSGGLSVLCALLCCKGLRGASSFFALLLCFNFQSHCSPCCLVSFLIAVVLVLCDSTLEGEQKNQKKKLALPRRLVDDRSLLFLLLSFLVFFFFLSRLFFWLFWSWAKELLIHCQMFDSKGFCSFKRDCIVSLCVYVCDPFEVPHDSEHWGGAGICQLMGDNRHTHTREHRPCALFFFLSPTHKQTHARRTLPANRWQHYSEDDCWELSN